MGVYKKIKAYVPDMEGLLLLVLLLVIGSSAFLIAEYRRIYLFLEIILQGQGLENLTLLIAMLALCALAYTITSFLATLVSHFIAFRLEANLKKAGMDALLDAPFLSLISILLEKSAKCLTTTLR